MKANAFLELRNKIRSGICLIPQTSGGQVISIDVDPDTEDLLVTWQHADGQRTYRVTITEESPDVPRETSGVVPAHDAMVAFVRESDRIIAEYGGESTPSMTKEEWDIHMQEIARRAAEIEDVPRETKEGS